MSLYFASSVQMFADACVEFERESSEKITKLEMDLVLARADASLMRSELNELKQRLAVVQNANMPQVCLEVSKSESDEIEAKRLKRNQASRERTKRETVKCECGGSSRVNEGAHRENHEASKKHQNWLKNINREGEGDQFADAFYE